MSAGLVRRVNIYGVECIIAIAIGDAVAVFIKHIFSFLLQAPFAVLLDGTDGTQEVEVWVIDAAFFFLRFVNGEVHHHATADKMPGDELSCKCDAFQSSCDDAETMGTAFALTVLVILLAVFQSGDFVVELFGLLLVFL